MEHFRIPYGPTDYPALSRRNSRRKLDPERPEFLDPWSAWWSVGASARWKNCATLSKFRVAFCGGVSSFVDRPVFSRLIVHRHAGECQLAAIFYPRFQQVQAPFFLRHEFQRVRGTRRGWRAPAVARIPRPDQFLFAPC